MKRGSTPATPHWRDSEANVDIRSGFRTAFTGKDNASIDIGRILWAVAAVLFGVLE
jgi:hypothetical protein